MNPWINLPHTPPFVLPEDADAIARFNTSVAEQGDQTRARPDLAIHTELLPEPFSGDLEAPVVVLLLNPGFSGDDAKTHALPEFRAQWRSMIRQEQRLNHLLAPAVDGPGARWWRARTSKLSPAAVLARKMLAVQYFPYHSKRYAHHSLRIPSQEFSFRVVRQAKERGAFIVCTRAKSVWCQAVEGLEEYDNFVTLKNPRSVYFTPKNLPRFDDLVAALLAEPSGQNQSMQPSATTGPQLGST